MKTLHVHQSTYFATKLILSFVVFSCCITVRAQMITIRGIVSVHNSKFSTGERKYIENATVADNFGRAQDALTRTDGTFALIYAKGVKESETCEFSVEKSGYEVVNITDLKAVAGQKDTVRISMALYGDMAKFRSEFYKIGKAESEKNLEKQLVAKNQQLAALQKDQSKNEGRIEQLTAEIRNLTNQSENIDAQVRNIIKTYAAINLDDESPLIGRSIDFFRRGLLDSALLLVNQSASAANVASLKQTQKEITQSKSELIAKEARNNQQMADAGRALLLEADIFKTRFQIDSATECYNRLMYLDSGNARYLESYAIHLAWLNQYNKAIYYYQKALKVYETADKGLHIYDAEIANVLNNLGMAYLGKLDFGNVEKLLQKALQIREELVRKSPLNNQPLLAVSYNNLGKFFKETTRFQEASNAYAKASDIFITLSKTNPGVYDESLAKVQTNLGLLNTELKKYSESEAVLLKALTTWSKLYADSSELHETYLATTQVNLGNCYIYMKDYDKAEIYMTQALQHNERLAKKNPLTYQLELAKTLFNIGDLYMLRSDYQMAEKRLLEALSVYNELPDNKANQQLIARIESTLAELYLLTGQPGKAKRNIEIAINIITQLGKDQPNLYAVETAKAQTIMGEIYADEKDLNKAETFYLKAQAAIIQSAKYSGLENQEELINIQTKLSDLYSKMNLLDKSVSMSKSIVASYRKLVAAAKDIYESKLAEALNNLGDFYNMQKDVLNARKALKEAVFLYANLYKKSPQVHGYNYGIALITTGDLYKLEKKWDSAKLFYEQAVNLYRTLAKDNSTTYTQQIAFALTYSGGLSLETGVSADAAVFLREAFDIQMTVVTANKEADVTDAGNTGVQLLTALEMEQDKTIQQGETWKTCQQQIRNLEVTLKRFAKQNNEIRSVLVQHSVQRANDLLFASRFADAEQAARTALSVDTADVYTKAALAHALLLQGKYPEAQDIYTALKPLKDARQQRMVIICIADLEKLKAKKITNEWVDRAISFLKQ